MVPRPGLVLMARNPPCSSTEANTTCNPSPVPSALPTCECVNACTQFSNSARPMPRPVSRTEMHRNSLFSAPMISSMWCGCSTTSYADADADAAECGLDWRPVGVPVGSILSSPAPAVAFTPRQPSPCHTRLCHRAGAGRDCNCALVAADAIALPHRSSSGTGARRGSSDAKLARSPRDPCTGSLPTDAASPPLAPTLSELPHDSATRRSWSSHESARPAVRVHPMRTAMEPRVVNFRALDTTFATQRRTRSLSHVTRWQGILPRASSSSETADPVAAVRAAFSMLVYSARKLCGSHTVNCSPCSMRFVSSTLSTMRESTDTLCSQAWKVGAPFSSVCTAASSSSAMVSE
mmetsp:Transcript_21919/g.70564  ORF Transcript_21919/g.70564 Transcript_21919/m.70564 type:complete len:350 (-) Transcript_21919:315-1364(-)